MKIKYVQAHFGIQPGTITDEPNESVVAELTRTEVFDHATQQTVKVAPKAVRVPDNTPTTEEAQIKAAGGDPKTGTAAAKRAAAAKEKTEKATTK